VNAPSALLLAMSASLLGACASLTAPGCGEGLHAAAVDALYFGTARTQGAVTEAEWSDFLASDVTPRFPEGLTTWSAQGQWRGTDGAIVHETSHVLLLVHPEEAPADAKVEALVAIYKARFDQQAVLRVKSRACIAP
jgi:hypothetical protein